MPIAAGAQSGTYVSPSIVNSPPQVDAANFINAGIWNIATAPYPFQTFNTLNYTNTGTMNGAVGWEFDEGPNPPGVRGWSANFFNDNNAAITASDLTFFLIQNDPVTVSYLLVSATNLVNKGTLQAGPNGKLVLNGSEVNLSRSFIDITPIVGAGSDNGNITNFTGDTAIYDEYWSAGTNTFTQYGSPWDGTTVGMFTAHGVGEPCAVLNAFVSIGPLVPQVADSYSNNLNPFILTTTNSDLIGTQSYIVYSNSVRQAIFVFVNDTNIIPTTHFVLSLGPSNIFLPMAVQLATVSTNVVTLTTQTNTLYVVDNLAAVGTNGPLAVNTFLNPGAACTDPTYRPNSVIVSRLDPGGLFALGAHGFGPPSGTFFYDPLTFSNFVATVRADAYSALVDNLAGEPPPGFSITNAPGKIEINAKDLDLSRTRMSAASVIMIQASNLVGSAGAVVDCQNLIYNLGSTNGSLNVVNLAVQNVHRLQGTINEWSGFWTNHMLNVYTNYVTNSVSGGAMRSDLTNSVEMDLAITVVDAGALQTTIPVDVLNLTLHSTNMVVTDFMQVSQNLLLDGQSLTIQGGLTLYNVLQNWISANAPTLRFFTNNGSLQIPNSAHFGDDRATDYADFVNHGFIFAGGQNIDSDYLEISGGTNQANAADFTAYCQTGLVMNATIAAVGNVQFFANSLTIDPSTLSAGGPLNFTVTNVLTDGGIAGNAFNCTNGFNLLIKPAAGGLLGTTLTDTALQQDEVDHVWAGQDFGTNAAGYLNNAAIGTLILNQDANNGFFTPLFYFAGAGTGNGLYVSNLDLSTLTDYTNELEINPNLTIYFAAATLNSDVKIAPFPSASAFLDGKFGGHLRWVQGLVAPQTTKISGAIVSGGKFQFGLTSSTGSSGQTNIVQVSTNLTSWLPVYTNVGSLTFTDAAANIYPRRFYRVMTLP